MSIKILKTGKTFKEICPICGCEFTYQLNDLTLTPTSNFYIVNCPECHLNIALNNEDDAVKLKYRYLGLKI